MARVRIKHMKRARTKGRNYWYHRLTRERLPDDETARIRRVLEINEDLDKPGRRVRSGSFASVANSYRLSPGFKSLAEKTRRDRSRNLELICDRWGDLPVAKLRRKNVLELRDYYAETPAKANIVVAVLRALLAFAIDREEATENVAKNIPRLKMGPGYKDWPQWAIDRYLAQIDGMMRLAFLLGLYTGQREGDVLRMRWSDYDGAFIKVRQAKTQTPLEIPVHTALKAALDAQQKVGPYMITTTKGLPYRSSNFWGAWQRSLARAGLDGQGLVYHGLRYTAASILAELGCSPHEIAAITGHKSLVMLTKYTAFADQKRRAGAAIHRWEQNPRRTKGGKPGS